MLAVNIQRVFGRDLSDLCEYANTMQCYDLDSQS